MIQEYRKATAEALGLVIIETHRDNLIIHFPQIGKPDRQVWHPDTDANQMLMALEWVRSQGWFVQTDLVPNGDSIVDIIKFSPKEILYQGYDKDIKLATMKAFMEYQEERQ